MTLKNYRIKINYAKDKYKIEPDEEPDIQIFDENNNLKAIGEVKTFDNIREYDFKKQIIPFAEKALKLRIPFYLSIPEINKEKTIELVKSYDILKKLYNLKLLKLNSYNNNEKIELKNITLF